VYRTSTGGQIESRAVSPGSPTPLNGREWVTAYAQRLGVPAPSPEDFERILDLAGKAAHASERVAAPVACWVAARAGVGLEDALQIATEVSGG
jgi:hypothetical protein